MPNPQNVASPINIHGIGRSGTTLLQNIFGATGFVQICNEMSGFTFCCYRGGELLNPSDDKEAPGLPGEPALAVRALHGAICAALPSSKSSWCQKLGGIPNYVVWNMITAADRHFAVQPYPFPFEWFWQTLSIAFPLSKDVLIFRDYRDVIISRALYSGGTLEDIAADVATYMNLMSHPASRIDQVVRFEDLAMTPGPIISDLFRILGFAYRDELLTVMNSYAAPSPCRNLEEARRGSFSWRERHRIEISDRIRKIVGPAEERFNARFSTGSVANHATVKGGLLPTAYSTGPVEARTVPLQSNHYRITYKS